MLVNLPVLFHLIHFMNEETEVWGWIICHCLIAANKQWSWDPDLGWIVALITGNICYFDRDEINREITDYREEISPKILKLATLPLGMVHSLSRRTVKQQQGNLLFGQLQKHSSTELQLNGRN